MSATAEPSTSGTQRLHTIGAVCERLREEFPDISISKIRYLEDQGLLAPRRTRGGYRLFSDGDVERLATILRLQRDAFLPLKVIREELDAQTPERARRRAAPVSEADIPGACSRIARFGIDARHLRAFRTGADRQSTLLEQAVAPALRSRNPERRKGAVEALEALAAAAQELSQALFLRDLRELLER